MSSNNQIDQLIDVAQKASSSAEKDLVAKQLLETLLDMGGEALSGKAEAFFGDEQTGGKDLLKAAFAADQAKHAAAVRAAIGDGQSAFSQAVDAGTEPGERSKSADFFQDATAVNNRPGGLKTAKACADYEKSAVDPTQEKEQQADHSDDYDAGAGVGSSG